MPRFRFRLDPLLRVRRQAERAKQIVVADLQRQSSELEAALRRRQELIESARQAHVGRLTGRLDVTALRGTAAETLRHLRDASRLAVELAGVRRRLEAAQSALRDAARDRRAVELVRQRRFDEWKRRLERRELAEHDEMAARGAPGLAAGSTASPPAEDPMGDEP
jgi:flagellar FliJ protein